MCVWEKLALVAALHVTAGELCFVGAPSHTDVYGQQELHLCVVQPGIQRAPSVTRSVRGRMLANVFDLSVWCGRYMMRAMQAATEERFSAHE